MIILYFKKMVVDPPQKKQLQLYERAKHVCFNGPFCRGWWAVIILCMKHLDQVIIWSLGMGGDLIPQPAEGHCVCVFVAGGWWLLWMTGAILSGWHRFFVEKALGDSLLGHGGHAAGTKKIHTFIFLPVQDSRQRTSKHQTLTMPTGRTMLEYRMNFVCIVCPLQFPIVI